MQRRTKIVATLGPVSTNAEVLAKLMTAGCDVFRLNFSHGSGEKLIELANQVREIADSLGYTVGILADLQGPKIRIGKFADGKISLKTGDKFILDAKCEVGNQERVGLDYKELPNDVGPGSILLLDDGRIVLHVDQVRGSEVYTTVESGGPLSNNKGINRRGGGLTAPPLTEKDMLDIRVAAAMKADYLAVSFPRSGSDMQFARELLRVAGGQSRLVAKIERAEAIPALDDILKASDGIMVARGDLAVEVGDAAVPGLQKKMIRAARERNRLVITATQMMESMISSPVPTRAEVSDVANAVLDGTDAVMLSAETAVGEYPVETVTAMARVCVEAEKEQGPALERRRGLQHAANTEEAIAQAVVFACETLDIKAVASLTQSGMTPLLISRKGPEVPVYALTPLTETRRRVSLFRGVYPVMFDHASDDPEVVLDAAEDELQKRGAVKIGDYIIITIGEPFHKAGGTNTMKIIRVGEHRSPAGG
jgi:pyruvate kinase